jgi:hypothetical protein
VCNSSETSGKSSVDAGGGGRSLPRKFKKRALLGNLSIKQALYLKLILRLNLCVMAIKSSKVKEPIYMKYNG